VVLEELQMYPGLAPVGGHSRRGRAGRQVPGGRLRLPAPAVDLRLPEAGKRSGSPATISGPPATYAPSPSTSTSPSTPRRRPPSPASAFKRGPCRNQGTLAHQMTSVVWTPEGQLELPA
jgi:hypothetical protein